MPDLEEMVSMLQEFNKPEVVMEEGLFNVFHEMQLEDAIDQIEVQDEEGNLTAQVTVDGDD